MPPHKVVEILVVCDGVELFKREDYFEEMQLDGVMEGDCLIEVAIEPLGDLLFDGRGNRIRRLQVLEPGKEIANLEHAFGLDEFYLVVQINLITQRDSTTRRKTLVSGSTEWALCCDICAQGKTPRPM